MLIIHNYKHISKQHNIHQNEAVEIPFDGPYEKNKGDEKGNIKDKSGAIHTPMSRAKDLARQAFKQIQSKTKVK